MVGNEGKKRMKRLRKGGGDPRRGVHLVELDLKHGRQWGPFTLCTDLITDCVPINHSMSVCETERQ